MNQAKLEGRPVTEENECGLLESVLFEKLLLHNARLDGLEVTEAEVMGESIAAGVLHADVWLD